jgi:hypothetical protein
MQAGGNLRLGEALRVEQLVDGAQWHGMGQHPGAEDVGGHLEATSLPITGPRIGQDFAHLSS